MEQLHTANPHGTPGFSDLEVSPRQEGCTLPEALGAQLDHLQYEHTHHQYLANRYDLEQQKHSISPVSHGKADYSTPQPTPSTLPPTPGMSQHDAEKAAAGSAADGQQNQNQQRRYCGLAPVAFWALVVLAVLLVIGAVLGGVLGTQLNKGSSEDGAAGEEDGEGDDGAGGASGLLSGSKLAALSWDNHEGAARTTVFFQSDGELFYSRRDLNSEQWLQASISAQFEAISAPLSIRNGTPLAAVAVPYPYPFQVSLFYLDAGARIREIISTDTDLATWKRGALWNVDRIAATTSNLAAVSYWCDKFCWNSSMVVYQQPGGALRSISGQDWGEESKYLVTAAMGTPLAMTRVPYKADSTAGRLNRSSVSLLYSRDNQVNEHLYNRKWQYGWSNGVVGIIRNFFTSGGTQRTRLTLSQSSNNGLALAVGINSTGSVVSSYLLNNGSWARHDVVPATTFDNSNGSLTKSGPSEVSLTQIALNNNFSLYGMGNKKIVEWGWGNANPYEYYWTGMPYAQGGE